MKKIGLLLIIIFSAGIVCAQQTREERQAAKKARKEEQQRIALENSQRLKTIMATKMFVLEAHTLYGKSGMTYNLNPTINFVGFDGKNSTIQLSFDALIGWNGLGGVTIDGTITNVEIKGKEDKPGFTVRAQVQSNIGGSVRMIFQVSSDGNARVNMTGSFGERLTYQGRIVALSESTVYKGTPLF